MTPSSQTSLTVDNLFKTPVARTRLPDADTLNSNIYAEAAKWNQEHANTPKHVDAWPMARGWEIGPDFFGVLAGIKAVDMLKQIIEATVTEFVNDNHLATDFDPPRIADGCRIEASWATAIYDHAYLVDEHVHHGAHFVAVYYVKVPQEIDGRDNEAGYLLLRDPRPAMHVIRLAGQRTAELIRPEDGLLVVMPAYVSHAVRPFWCEGERLSINCNISITGVRLRGE